MTMKKAIALLIIAIPFVTTSFVWAQDPAKKSRPNIVWIFAEDMNAWMGCFGDMTVLTLPPSLIHLEC